MTVCLEKPLVGSLASSDLVSVSSGFEANHDLKILVGKLDAKC